MALQQPRVFVSVPGGTSTTALTIVRPLMTLHSDPQHGVSPASPASPEGGAESKSKSAPVEGLDKLAAMGMNGDTVADVSDLTLVERAQRGERGAFDLLVRKYQHKVLKLVGRFISNQAEAEDVAQDAFIKAYRALGSFRGDSAFYTWIYRIAINTAKNALVSNKRRPMDYLDMQDPEQYERQARLKELATPERLLLTEEIRQTVQQAMRDLPADLRTAIMLRELDGLSYEEIAEAMECPVGTVRSRIFRAREAIDGKLKPLLETE
jgi:RNA polymerase sigma-70 factor (ECF subfamily)